jgi:hypothetical protein
MISPNNGAYLKIKKYNATGTSKRYKYLSLLHCFRQGGIFLRGPAATVAAVERMFCCLADESIDSLLDISVISDADLADLPLH